MVRDYKTYNTPTVQHNSSSGIGVPTSVFIVFLVLKLTHYIAWSWWWVTAPLWGPLVLAIVGLIIFAVIFGGD